MQEFNIFDGSFLLLAVFITGAHFIRREAFHLFSFIYKETFLSLQCFLILEMALIIQQQANFANLNRLFEKL